MSVGTGVGLISGIDYESIINQMRAVNARPISLLQQKQARLQQEGSAMQSVNKALMDFKAKAELLSQRDGFLSVSGRTTDASIVNVSAENTATPATYQVKVLQLAQAHRLAGQGFDTADSTSIASASGAFSYQIGDGSVHSFDVTAGMTLQQLADAINNEENPPLRASIINDGTATNPYRLVLSAGETGADNAIKIVANDTTVNLATTTIEAAAADDGNQFNGTITSSGTYTGSTNRNVVLEITTAGAVGAAQYKVSLDGGVTWTAADAFTTATGDVDVTGAAGEGILASFAEDASPVAFAVGDRFTIDAFTPQMQAAQNAIIEADGIRVNRATNSFEDVVEDVTLTAVKVDEEAQTITIQSSTTGIKSRIADFVDTYNKLVDEIQTQTAYDTEAQRASPLFGDSAVNGALNMVRNIVTGFTGGLTTYTTLSAIGIGLNADNHLEVDATELDKALAADQNAVMKLFVESGQSTSSAVSFVSSTEATKTGDYAVNITQVAEQAAVVGTQTIGPGGLAADENLSITTNDATVYVSLSAGQSLNSIIETLNEKFQEEGMGAQASEDNGMLRIGTIGYGSAETVKVQSTKDAALADQLGIGTTAVEDDGLDVVGTINGLSAAGNGQRLTGGSYSAIDGLILEITASTPMVATLTLTQGVALKALRQVESLTDGETGMMAVRNETITESFDLYNERIQTIESRLDKEEETLRRKFSAMETKLNSLQTQGNFLMSQLNSLLA